MSADPISKDKKGEARRKITAFTACLVMLATITGCSTITGAVSTVYNAAVERRSVKTQLSDAQISAKVLGAFVADDRVKALDISVECYEKQVYLVGEYDNAAGKERAIELAEKTEGVEKVTAYMLHRKKDGPCGAVENLEIKAKIKALLLGDKEIFSTNVTVKTVQCNVVLLGIVGSEKEVKKATIHAESVKGVRKVISYLRVK